MEQIISNPSLFEDGIIVNSTIPANNQPLNCNSPTTDQGVTYVVALVTGGTFASGGASPGSGTTTFNSAFVNYRDTPTAGVQTNETGALTVVNTREGSTYLIGQDISIPTAGNAPGGAQQIALSDTTGESSDVDPAAVTARRARRNQDMYQRTAQRPSRTTGFTLIELMVTVLIVSVLVAIAVPSYIDKVRKSRRTDAKTALLDLAGREERFYNTNNTYSIAAAGSGLWHRIRHRIRPGRGQRLLQVSVTLTRPDRRCGYTLTATAVAAPTRPRTPAAVVHAPEHWPAELHTRHDAAAGSSAAGRPARAPRLV